MNPIQMCNRNINQKNIKIKHEILLGILSENFFGFLSDNITYYPPQRAGNQVFNFIKVKPYGHPPPPPLRHRAKKQRRDRVGRVLV